MTVRELRNILSQYENTKIDDAEIRVFDYTYTDNPVGVKIDNVEDFSSCNTIGINVSAKPDIVSDSNKDINQDHINAEQCKGITSDEYISRKDLMVILSDYYDTTVEYRSMLKEIAALPSVTLQLSSEINKSESDCISRKSVLKLIYDYKENHFNDREHYPINYGTLLDMIRWVVYLPSVVPQPKKGHWINCKCDKCGYVVQPWNTTKFCPNCGDMKEVKE